MTSFVIAWYAQDLLRVFSSGHFLVPEIFLLVLLYMALKHEDERCLYSLEQFLGGILWDLRCRVGWCFFSSLRGVHSLCPLDLAFPPFFSTKCPAFGLLIWSAHLV